MRTETDVLMNPERSCSHAPFGFTTKIPNSVFTEACYRFAASTSRWKTRRCKEHRYQW